VKASDAEPEAVAPRKPAVDPSLPNPAMREISIIGVFELGPGDNVVVIFEQTSSKLITMGIGEREAVTISMRLAGEKFPRPLTHDLLDRVLEEAGMKIARVEIDALQDSTFLAHLYLQRNDGTLAKIDARPSDCMALAVGSGAPVYVAPAVLDETGITPQELGIDPKDIPGYRDTQTVASR
jgi:bifunctional DNase/RNase